MAQGQRVPQPQKAHPSPASAGGWTVWDIAWLLLALGALGVSARGFLRDQAHTAQALRVQSAMAAATPWRRSVEQHAVRDEQPTCAALPAHLRLADGTVLGCKSGAVQIDVPPTPQVAEVRLTLTPVWRDGGLTWTCDARVPLSALVPIPCHR